MIFVEDITLRYGEKLVLDRVSLSIPATGLTWLSGPSGRGKTSLLRILAGLRRPDGGSVRFPPAVTHPVLLFQEDRLFPGRTALQQVEAVLPRRSRSEAMGWLELVGLSEAAGLKPEELSGGMARRTALARALASEGDLLLLDEPFAGVDPDRAAEILAGLRSLGRPAVITGHSPRLSGLCDRQLEL